MNINWSNDVYKYYHATTDQPQQQSQLNAHIRQTAPLEATYFIKVNNQYSEVIFVVFYYFCFIAN